MFIALYYNTLQNKNINTSYTIIHSCQARNKLHISDDDLKKENLQSICVLQNCRAGLR